MKTFLLAAALFGALLATTYLDHLDAREQRRALAVVACYQDPLSIHGLVPCAPEGGAHQ